MDILNEFYVELDKSDYDSHSFSEINSALIAISSKLNETSNFERLRVSELEREAFAITKNVGNIEKAQDGIINGLGFRMSGTQTSEDGIKVPYYWPDVRKLEINDFEYFELRYKQCKNIFARVEFGLLLYLGAKTDYSKHIDFKKSLVDDLIILSRNYLKKSTVAENNPYRLDYIDTIKKAFIVAQKCKIPDRLNLIIDEIYKTLINWDVKFEGTFPLLNDFSNLTLEHFRSFKSIVDYNTIIEVNMKGAKEFESNRTWHSISLVDNCIKIAKKNNLNDKIFLIYKAKLYIKLANEAELNNNIAAVKFCEIALRIYQKSKETASIIETEKKYSELRGKFRLALIKDNFPKDENDRIIQNIKHIVSVSNEDEIIQYLINTPWYKSTTEIKKNADQAKLRDGISKSFGRSILDKYGNTIDSFQTEDEKELFDFWQSYNYSYQFGTQCMYLFFHEAYSNQKITFESILCHLKSSWLNEPIDRNYSGDLYQIVPLNLIIPGLKRFFEELNLAFFSNNPHSIDLITVLDSLVLKIETLIRNMCEKIGIATFKTRLKGTNEVVMEKLLDDMLVDLRHSETNPTGFLEDDRIFIKYVMTEKCGSNLRNEVAHGLMDYEDYTLSDVIVTLSIILKMSRYIYTKKQVE